MRQTLVIFLIMLISCSHRLISDSKNNLSRKQDTIGQFIYINKDTISRLSISYHECTECLDAYVDNGILFLPDSVIQKIKNVFEKRGIGFIPNGHDIYLTGQDRIKEILFGDTLNFGEHWHDKFIITGKAIDMKGLGIVFRVDKYKKIDKNKTE
jgi:hypothetical protein